MGWTQETSKVVGSGPKVWVEIDASVIVQRLETRREIGGRVQGRRNRKGRNLCYLAMNRMKKKPRMSGKVGTICSVAV